jgi:hypothetical protein
VFAYLQPAELRRKIDACNALSQGPPMELMVWAVV